MYSDFVTYGSDCRPIESDAGESVSDDVYVLAIKTTGDEDPSKDIVVDIGIADADLGKGTVAKVFSSTLGYEVDEWDECYSQAPVFRETEITADMIRESMPAKRVMEEVRRLVRGKVVTSYDIGFNLRMFLYQEPWNLKGTFIQANDILHAATRACRMPTNVFGMDYGYPQLYYAYGMLTEGDPAGVGEKPTHRAYQEAAVAAYVMVSLYRDGLYHPFRKI